MLPWVDPWQRPEIIRPILAVEQVNSWTADAGCIQKSLAVTSPAFFCLS